MTTTDLLLHFFFLLKLKFKISRAFFISDLKDRLIVRFKLRCSRNRGAQNARHGSGAVILSFRVEFLGSVETSVVRHTGVVVDEVSVVDHPVGAGLQGLVHQLGHTELNDSSRTVIKLWIKKKFKISRPCSCL